MFPKITSSGLEFFELKFDTLIEKISNIESKLDTLLLAIERLNKNEIIDKRVSQWLESITKDSHKIK